MFFKRKCLHTWHYIDSSYDPIFYRHTPLIESYVWIWCSDCRKEKKVTAEEWHRIRIQQLILKNIKHKETYCPHNYEWDDSPDCRH